MKVGLIGRKCGMTQIFEKDGTLVPVSVILVEPMSVTQIKTKAKEGYDAIQVANGKRKPNRVNKPLAGHFAKAGVNPGTMVKEFALDSDEVTNYQLGQVLSLDLLKVGQYVDVVGVSKGKGFAGTHKRHNFSLQYASHGNSLSHRAPGSIGQNQTPGRVMKGKKMAGHMGNKRVTVQSLKVVGVNLDSNTLLVRGAIPGAVDGKLVIKPAIKKSLVINNAG